MWACVPRAPLPGTDYIRTNMQKFGLWGKFCEHNGAQRVEDVSGHWTCHIYFGWDLAVVMFTVPNNIACSKIPGFVLPAPFLHTQLHLGHRDGCWVDVSYHLHPWVKLWCQDLKSLKKAEIERYSSLEFIWNKGNSPAPHWAEGGGGCPPVCLCFVRQVRICVWLAAALDEGLRITERRELGWETLPLKQACLVTQRQFCKERCTCNSCSRSRDCLE